MSKTLFLILGPLSFALIQLFVKPEGLAPEAVSILAITVWMAIWWVSEAVPIAITSILPLVLFPVTGAMDMRATAAPYSRPIIYIFMGGFMIALAMEKWNLHRRIALSIIAAVGTNMKQIVLGFVLAAGILSMWISNTATTVMMLPIGLAIVSQFMVLGKDAGLTEKVLDNFSKALILSIAYCASIGGMATLVGTPTNLVFIGFVEETYQAELSFAKWMLLGFPITVILWGVTWWHLTHNAFPLSGKRIAGSKQIIQDQLKKLGRISYEERWVMGVFATVAFAWISRKYILNPFLPGINDTSIAMAGAAVLFVIPSSKKGQFLMDWPTALKLPWGVLLLFGGAFAVAAGFDQTGLAQWMGEKLSLMKGTPYIAVLSVVVTMVNFLTEIAQNMATCALMMPVLSELSINLGVHPYALMVSATIASSCAFMLPVATAPNAIVFGSGMIKMRDMVRAGFLLNVLSILIIILFSYFLLPYIWGIEVYEPTGVFAR
ncbi:MAG: SLC13 family permease [Bacteroidota bacterium]